MAGTRKIFPIFIWIGAIVLLAVGVGYYVLYHKDKNAVPPGFVMGNGRIEATEIDIATKQSGRLAAVLVKEGDFVRANQILARMDTATLEAQLRQAQAEVRRAEEARQSALAKVEESQGKVALAGKELERSGRLLAKGFATPQRFDHDQTTKRSADAEYASDKARVGEAGAAIGAAIARTEYLQAEIDDCLLKSPVKGRVLLRLAEPGEILPPGGKVLTVIDPEEMFMTIFLPEKEAGNLSIGAEARVIPDAFPDHPLRAKVAFVSAKAQFTPKEVETAEERQKLTFRVKIRLETNRDSRLKPGLPGTSWVRLDPRAKWPTPPQ
jgi:HlyD family secretion protein